MLFFMMPPSSSSKVTVEYYDPFSVYQLLSPGLLPRLPLRNLHWESHAGPLRSINSLHVDLVSATDSTLSSTSASVTDSSQSALNDGSNDGFQPQALGVAAGEKPEPQSGPPADLVKGRRHQIPGLRQTPYLKIFLLRCDDNETYKASARKQVREWIKKFAPPTSSTAKVNSQENHDAFEWLIVHVVVPNTAAATQPKTATKGTTPLLEKLRADFNSTSKNSVDRVAQIRIGVNDVPYDILPRVVPAIPGSNSYTETPQEHQESWTDLITKLKVLILSSFDMRVSQYEEDIKEREVQRTLPGWNFCTFFVLKEGLARGFESVGLVEDALVGYDELSVGLDTIAHEQAGPNLSPASTSSFLPFTRDLQDLMEATRASILQESGTESESDGPIDLQSSSSTKALEDEIPLSSSKKNYRDLILSNDISLFDFRCYLFARQLALLLRLGNASISREELLTKLQEQRESNLRGIAARSVPTQPPDEAENLSILGEVCKRSLAFIALMTRVMREDMEAAQLASEKKSGIKRLDTSRLKAVSNIITSFTFSVAQQILAQTSTKSLPIPASTLAPASEMPGQEPKATIPEPKTMMHPARSSSLLIQSAREPTSPNTFPGGRRSSVSDAGTSKSFQLQKPGLEELAAHRAELYLLSRGVLERLGQERGWSVGWSEALDGLNGSISQMKIISLSDETHKSTLTATEFLPTLHGLSNSLLRVAMSTKDDFYRLYETLTDKALRHHTVASHLDSAQVSMVDLAVLKYHMKDYAAAASYLYRMTPCYGDEGWEHVELHMLVLYTRCLKELQRHVDYTRVCLKLLGKAAAVEKGRTARKSTLKLGTYGGNSVSDLTVNVDGYLTELITILEKANHETTIALESIVAGVDVESSPMYHDGRDGFSLDLKLRYLLNDELPVQKVKVRLAPISGGQARDVWVECEEVPTFVKGNISVRVHSNVTIPGTYIVKQISLHAAKLNISYEVENVVLQPDLRFIQASPIRLYQRPESFDIRLLPSRHLHLSKTRTLELVMASGWNNIQSGELHIRAATAGLRLQTGELTNISGDLPITKNSVPGELKFGNLLQGKTVKLCLPFKIENDVPEISLKVEISYTTKAGTFFFATQLNLGVQLPLGVNVQDVFKHKVLFSKFSISSATPSPLRVLGSKLEDSDRFAATRGADLTSPVTVFHKQPATLLYKITRKQSNLSPIMDRAGLKEHPGLARQGSRDTANLALTIYYSCIDEEIEEALTKTLGEALTNTPYKPYTKVIIAAVSKELIARMSPLDLEHTALLNELSTAVLADAQWRDHLIGLGKASNSTQQLHSLLDEWLQCWQKATPYIPLLLPNVLPETLSKARSISIPVDIPPMSVVHTASLDLVASSATTSDKTDVIAITNTALSATLYIKATRAWDTGTNSAIENLRDLDFVYEITAPADSWLIGGKRKGHFKVPFSGPANIPRMSFPILLIPIREGHLPFPSVDIRPVQLNIPPRQDSQVDRVDDGRNQTEEEPEGPQVTCETYYKNAAEVVRVISGARKSTVSLDASGPQGGAWLLESEQRDVVVR